MMHLADSGDNAKTNFSKEWVISHFADSLSSGHFHIFLQPQVDMEGNVLGAEVLTRWIDSDGNMVPVNLFIPALIEADLITKMDLHIWELAIEQLSSWKGTSMENIYLSVNVEPKDIISIDVPSKLKELCEKYNVSVKRIHVEITERGFEEDSFPPDALIDEFHKNGIAVGIDDFGSGSSALSLLMDMEADALKLDRKFISTSSCKHNLRGKVILEAILGLSNKLHTTLIVEGVETECQKDCIQKIGCNIYQGFLFSKPVPVKVFEDLFFKSA